MADRPFRPRAHLVAAVLLLVFVVQGFYALARKSPTFDETGDIAAGLSYLQFFEVRANLQHPPLLKLISAVPVYVAGYRLPDTPAVHNMLALRGGERTAGSEFLAANGIEWPLALARIPMLLCAALLGLVLYLWGREMAGEVAALAALFLYCLDPNFMAHGYLATMDVGLALFATLFFFALWRYLEASGTRRLILAGVAMGLMLGGKFSGLVLVPVAAVLVVWGAEKRRRAVGAFLGMCGIAVLVVQTLYLSTGGLYLYVLGLSRVNQDHNPNYLVFLNGALDHSFLGYFPLAWFWKEPLVTTGLFGFGAYLVWRRRYRLFLLLPPVLFVAAHMAFADDLGFRYLLPALPFALLLAGIGVARLVEVRRWGVVAAGVLGLWMVVSAAALYPDQLSYFNEAACLPDHVGWIGVAGGTRCGPLRLDDSNVDWGQGLGELRDWLGTHAAGRTVRLGYFGSFPPGVYIRGAQVVGLDDLEREPGAGLYAISAHYVARIPWTLRREPVAIVGRAFWVYEVR